jgi:hypothetical protein
MTDALDPFGLRRQFDAELDRLEAAIDEDKIGNVGYGPLENQAMVALAQTFVESAAWDALEHHEQVAYQRRLAYLKSKSKGLQL